MAHKRVPRGVAKPIKTSNKPETTCSIVHTDVKTHFRCKKLYVFYLELKRNKINSNL